MLYQLSYFRKSDAKVGILRETTKFCDGRSRTALSVAALPGLPTATARKGCRGDDIGREGECRPARNASMAG